MRTTEFDFTFILYNSKGLKAQDVLDGALPEQYDGVFSFDNLICGAFQFVWFKTYPNGGSKDETLESLMLLNPTSDTSLGGDHDGHDLDKNSHDLDKDTYGENLHHEILSGNTAQTQFQSHLSTHDLKLDRQFPKLTASSAGAFQFVWFEIYQNWGSKDETFESLMLLNPASDTSLGGDHGGHDLDKDTFDENLRHEIPSGNNAQTQFQSHASTHDLELDGQYPNLTAGVDIDCPLNVPPKTASGKVNICQRFTATFRISSPENVSASSVRADVTAMYNDAFKDGTWTKAYLEVNSRYVVFRVPGHSYCELNYFESDCHWLFSRYDETNNTTGQRKHSLNAAGMGCILLLFSILGAFVYKKRAASSSFGSEGSEEEEEKEEFRDETLIEDGRSMYELKNVKRAQYAMMILVFVAQ
eukprot:CAMPEP_0197467066 /NCGR_PEP_ID=MMETSP1175-20131217/65376_1 /TAXON_ID=1003142 /ORGANISM="Triceratium dubium, Strain CCMP147" /LENGTH=414 /DNA_ID=CAMNT_0043003127 /DNA_START=46 /DNA_END=1285 /DNA_ORIENTATION=+